ncbi:DUF7838 family putative zinc beta-ribbon protein [Natronolimnobius baerhuensis]|uniref:DUF7838 domain-containing protein n=1 Tax=Natronolimnobius baerhuensis TaxID=253108 RepID=A0A202E7M2_9EURY|nr:hypothetical protein [Natronolimnobius baerhuensis]OVE84214.1 hypothetical protein B2G88_07275 [Natronolimnobius baerhuensis]
MTLELDHECPDCEADKTFYRAASTTLHLGTKIKWHCPDCDYGFIQINGNREDPIDSSVSA